MASGLPGTTSSKRRTTTAAATPEIVTTGAEGDDFDPNNSDHASTSALASDSGNDSFLVPTPSSSTLNSRAPSPRAENTSSDFLHPEESHPQRPPTPSLTFTMAFDDAPPLPADNGFESLNMNNAAAQSPPRDQGPFNFQTQFISTTPVKPNIGQRRGHRYKHSSISAQHQIFQEPPPRPPPVLPASLPVPTLREAWASMQREQRARLFWCACHVAVALYVFFSAGDSLALTALAHLVFFDVGSAAVCVAVDVLGNFEVWRRSSVRHPFGLQRAEVLAGFAMSVFLVFGGFDLLSHELKHVLESVGGHAPHHPHDHDHLQSLGSVSLPPLDPVSASVLVSSTRVAPGSVDTASLAAAVSTLVSAYGLRNHARVRRVMRVPLPPRLGRLLPGGVLENPFHSLTLFFSFVMLALPLLSVATYLWLDRLICAAISVCMFLLGARLSAAQGRMLLMSYSGRRVAGAGGAEFSDSSSSGGGIGHDLSLLGGVAGGGGGGGGDMMKRKKEKVDDAIDTSDGGASSNGSVSAVLREIEAEPSVARVEEAQFWQVHYGLAVANLRLCLVRGCDDGVLSQVRARVARVVQSRLGEGYGRGNSLRWEVTVQTSTDRN